MMSTSVPLPIDQSAAPRAEAKVLSLPSRQFPKKPTSETIADHIAAAETPLGTGKTFYVESGATGGDTGKDWTNAALTIDAAIGLCVASRQGHIRFRARTIPNPAGRSG